MRGLSKTEYANLQEMLVTYLQHNGHKATVLGVHPRFAEEVDLQPFCTAHGVELKIVRQIPAMAICYRPKKKDWE